MAFKECKFITSGLWIVKKDLHFRNYKHHHSGPWPRWVNVTWQMSTDHHVKSNKKRMVQNFKIIWPLKYYIYDERNKVSENQIMFGHETHQHSDDAHAIYQSFHKHIFWKIKLNVEKLLLTWNNFNLTWKSNDMPSKVWDEILLELIHVSKRVLF